MHDDLSSVAGKMGAQIGNFQSTFAPQLKLPIDLWKGILDALGVMTGFIYAGLWNNSKSSNL